MKTTERTTERIALRFFMMLVVMLVMAGLTSRASAQVPARFYWKTLSDSNAFPLIVQSISGNANPFDPSLVVTADADIDALLGIGGYARTFTLFDRSAMGAIMIPFGELSGEFTLANQSFDESTGGFGDPILEFDINLIGPKAQKNIPDTIRYEPKISIDFLVDLALPIGEYDSDEPLNLGQNRWYGRVGAPIILQLGPWIPGQRTTLEFLPAVWLFGDNDDYLGETLETDPMFQLDAHLTRDFTERFWGSIDAVWYTGGKATIDGVSGDSLNNFGLGFTFGYQINDNMSLTFGYKTTIDDNDPGDLEMNNFMISFVYGWHPLIEGSKRLQSE